MKSFLRSTTPRTDLGERLVDAGLLTSTQLELAIREQRGRGTPLSRTLLELGFLAPEKLSGFVAREAEATFVDINQITIDRAAVDLVPRDILLRYRCLPLEQGPGSLKVAMADPFNVVAIDALRQITGLQLEVVTATDRDILNYLDRMVRPDDTIQESIDQIIEERTQDEPTPIEVESDAAEAADADAPTIRLVTQIITRAVRNGASDIHFEPEERMMRVRIRLDGVLHPDVLIPKSLQSLVTVRMKVLAELDVSETRVPQDGRATVYVDRRRVNLRVSSLPTAHGESIVARILNAESQVLQLAALGFEPSVERQLRRILDQPHGVLMVTGPTGSGKTTTLYAMLNEISSGELSIFTLEDPIEYRVPGIRQTQVKEEVGLTFASGLRSLLRQDPDVILVGETRDTETAQLMVRSALTGHLVFSTLHTNDAAGAIPRLIDMGVEPYLLPDSLIGVLAQRLVRKVCRQCSEPVAHPERVFEELGLEVPRDQPLQLWRGQGCPQCNGTGYRGRQAIFELMVLDDRFHGPIVQRSGAPEYHRLARQAGMRTMFEDGIRHALNGTTTMSELLRVTRCNTQS